MLQGFRLRQWRGIVDLRGDGQHKRVHLVEILAAELRGVEHGTLLQHLFLFCLGHFAPGQRLVRRAQVYGLGEVALFNLHVGGLRQVTAALGLQNHFRFLLFLILILLFNFN